MGTPKPKGQFSKEQKVFLAPGSLFTLPTGVPSDPDLHLRDDGLKQTLFQKEQRLVNEEPRTEVGKEAQRPTAPGCQAWSRPACSNRTRASRAPGRKLLPRRWVQNSERHSHRERGCPFASINSCVDFRRLRGRNQDMEGTKEQGATWKAACQEN